MQVRRPLEGELYYRSLIFCLAVKETELNSLRESLSDLKKTKDKLRASNLRLK